MNYRQWKKNYKKRHGVNPPASIDKRKRRKAVARATKALAKVDFMESIGRAAETLTGVMANLCVRWGMEWTQQGQCAGTQRIICSH